MIDTLAMLLPSAVLQTAQKCAAAGLQSVSTASHTSAGPLLTAVPVQASSMHGTATSSTGNKQAKLDCRKCSRRLRNDLTEYLENCTYYVIYEHQTLAFYRTPLSKAILLKLTAARLSRNSRWLQNPTVHCRVHSSPKLGYINPLHTPHPHPTPHHIYSTYILILSFRRSLGLPRGLIPPGYRTKNFESISDITLSISFRWI